MKQHSIQVAVVGATGYGGSEVIRLLASHPCAKVTVATSARRAGSPLREECPWLSSDLVLSEFDPTGIKADFTFLCQESGFAMEVAELLEGKTRVIDLSADFRLDDLATYEAYYGRKHTNPHLAKKPVYGLPELVDREAIANADLVANPGCYPTATLLALMPLVRLGLVSGVPVVDAKSGVSGAGRSRKETEYMFSELSGGFRAYGAVGHRHTAEIEQLSEMQVRFTPHLIPIARGIHSTAHVPLKTTMPKTEIRKIFDDFYREERFVMVQDAPPSTKQVQGSNMCAISVDADERCGYAVVCSVIDNLVKGMAGQAIQNMNLMAGISEEAGLPMDGMWP
jgi:N-acetyl-gamma-glutamyl-phosphate reductase